MSKQCPEPNCTVCVQGKAKRPARRKSRRNRQWLAEYLEEARQGGWLNAFKRQSKSGGRA